MKTMNLLFQSMECVLATTTSTLMLLSPVMGQVGQTVLILTLKHFHLYRYQGSVLLSEVDSMARIKYL